MTDDEQPVNPISGIRRLMGFAGGRSTEERSLDPELLATYRLRVVAVGALITAAVLANLVIYAALTDDTKLRSVGFLAVMFLGMVALGGVVLTPWDRVLVSRWALRSLYGWSAYSVLLVGAAVYFDGGGHSVMYLMFPVLTVFFAIAYKRRPQALLLGVTLATYLGVSAVKGWGLTAGEVYMRIATLVLTAYVGSVLSGWLVTEMRNRAQSSTTAEQRAGMLDTVARAARRVGSLDASQVLGAALSGALELGCLDAEIWLNEGDPPVLKLQRRAGGQVDPTDDDQAVETFGRARISGSDRFEIDPLTTSLASVIYREGEPAGMLLVQMTAADSADLLMIECIELLAVQVSAGLDVARNVAERRGLEERLAHWAFHDSLTDLPNRVLFADRLELALARVARDGTYVAVLFLDLDGFKKINDTLGHAAGDEYLQSVAHRLHACLRPNDTLARYGGDEFVVLVEQIEGPEVAIAVANRILDALSRPVSVGASELPVRTSIGIAVTGARPGADSDVLRRADMSMYQAKASGGSCYVLSPAPDT